MACVAEVEQQVSVPAFQTSWTQLPFNCMDHIARFLTTGEVALTLRLLNKATAKHFRCAQYTTVRLSQTSPLHAFARHWGAPGATGHLTRKQRRRLVCLTAASGSIANLEVAISAAGCQTDADVFEAVVSGSAPDQDKLAMCEWLQQQGCPEGRSLECAAKAGSQAACRWLLANGAAWAIGAVCSAAHGGHGDLAEWLMQQRPLPAQAVHAGTEAGSAAAAADQASVTAELALVLASVAAGCGLPLLQRMHRKWLERQGYGPARPAPSHVLPAEILAAAAASPTPDWREKVEWLESQGYPAHPEAFEAAAAGGEEHFAASRLAWLRQRGYSSGAAVSHAVRAGDAQALEYLLSRDPRFTFIGQSSIGSAASLGRLEVFKLLWAYGWSLDEIAFSKAAAAGRMEAAVWLAEGMGLTAPGRLRPRHMAWAAQSGCVALMAWLRERGCPWDEDVFAAAAGAETATAVAAAVAETAGTPATAETAAAGAAEAGAPVATRAGPAAAAAAVNAASSVAAMAWLREHGCPWGERSFTKAAAVGCVEALEWLAERGCPMGQKGGAYVTAARNGDLATLRALRRLGCPWDPTGGTFTSCACSSPLHALEWLLEAGCPVDWAKAERAVRWRRGPVATWMSAQRRQRWAAVAQELEECV